MTSFDPARIFQTLDRHGVDYLTIGGWAVIAHGYVRATADIDFVARLDENNMNRLAAALSELDARLRGVDADKSDIDPTDPEVLSSGASFTMLGIIIGVGAVVALISVGQGAQQGIDQSLATLGANQISVTATTPTGLTEQDAEALTEIEGVLRVSTEVRGQGSVSYGSKQENFAIIGVSETYAELANPEHCGRVVSLVSTRSTVWPGSGVECERVGRS